MALKAAIAVSVADLKPFVFQANHLQIVAHSHEGLLNPGHHQAVLAFAAEVRAIFRDGAIAAPHGSFVVAIRSVVRPGCFA